MGDMEIVYKALEKWGPESQFGIIQEELAELISALSRYMRGREGAEDALYEEIADVQLCMMTLVLIFGGDRLDNIRDDKLSRLNRRIEAPTTKEVADE